MLVTITISSDAIQRAAERLDDFSNPYDAIAVRAAIEAALGIGESEGSHFVVEFKDENKKVAEA